MLRWLAVPRTGPDVVCLRKHCLNKALISNHCSAELPLTSVFSLLHSTVLVFSFSGTTAAATVVAVTCGMYRIVAHETLPNLGGQNIDEVLAQHLASEFKRYQKDCWHHIDLTISASLTHGKRAPNLRQGMKQVDNTL